MGSSCSPQAYPLNTMELVEAVEDEITSLHVFFTDWFSGKGQFKDLDNNERNELFDSYMERFHDNMTYVMPGGTIHGKGSLVGMRDTFGSSPDFCIKVENLKVAPVPGSGGRVLSGTYCEYQRGAKNSQRENGRRTTFEMLAGREAGNRKIIWYRLHECWLPEEEVKKYDFSKIESKS
ncbi:hypothetical protein AAMO2058_000485000 [Amorphochlora amoebiformis]|uniref:SnoaL-like domain-containing protein n=1 Tax=Amorphochlora amoebiformis TaxID=1561963 RepID=A0A7S0DE38_9EUKA|mmetsp:Transcript_24735/g.39036  ORF Transcript_24735/g.39036 Transcript_24735/m.39036 type:complete len:178 (+) Transcript_24735:49-582(+)